ncbi:uncharacterized protein LOC112599029 [Melanaphis sacchari]|uniref:uncharacterized protein LOC112599029 n=1 Tax=Melanaphis sacchari TaxID=742174 RepID=UPI000DC13D9F|nr:uncharacterized protein LOC112599029 [Melanaphis sacchari]
MVKEQKIKKFEYKRRLKELKQTLKPYQNSQTVNLLRLNTRSCGARLDNYWESLEFTGNVACHLVEKRIQDVLNRILEYGEYDKPKTQVDVINKLKRLHIVRYRNNESKVNMLNSIRHINDNSRVNTFNNMGLGNIDLIANVVVDRLKHLNINSKANTDVDELKNLNIDSKTNMVIDKLEHCTLVTHQHYYNKI